MSERSERVILLPHRERNFLRIILYKLNAIRAQKCYNFKTVATQKVGVEFYRPKLIYGD